MDNAEKIARLEDIQTKIEEQVYEARGLLEGTGITLQRAERYWIAQILTALDNDDEYVGGSMFSLQDSINELKGEDDADSE
ncbi:MAG TPA: hypothetical protein P5556_00830 [Candidatus Gastranaerophilales bacterium]|nr:hypothetical protein [Candidatus Gastranaerophilales bacterium]